MSKDRDKPEEQDMSLEGAMREAFAGRDDTENAGGEVRARDLGSEILLRDDALEEDEALLPAQDDASPPERYQIFGEVARGGMGIVLKARDAELGREIALKVLQQRHMGSAEIVQRFVDEALIGGQLEHPGVVPVHDLCKLAKS